MDREASRNEVKIPKRILNTLLSSLTAGVVPRSGAPYVAIGRQQEIATLVDSLSAVSEGGSAMRLLVGRYGSGKSFLIQLIRGYALDHGFICADADLSPERRLSGGNGAGLATYRELMKNLASKASPDGGALPMVLSRHFDQLRAELAKKGILPEHSQFAGEMRARILETTMELEGYVGGFDFARVLGEYYLACISDDADRKSACLRWLRGEFSGKTEAKHALGFSVSAIIDDDSWYDFIKLWAVFSVRLGYGGLIVFIDECVNLYKISNRISRESNYEKLLAIFNDTLQGRAPHLGVLLGGTPQFLEDTRRGLFSYEALRSRLADGRFSEVGYQNLSAPVIRLRRLSDNELLALLQRLTILFSAKEGADARITPEEMQEFLRHALSRAGADEMVTPREIIRDYLTLLSILRDNGAVSFSEVMSRSSSSDGTRDASESDRQSAPTAPRVMPFDIEL